MFKWEQRDASAPTPRADFIVCWIKDLLDLKSKQTLECLHDNHGFCCLGIASNTAGYKWVWFENDENYRIVLNKSQYESFLPYDLKRFLRAYDSEVSFSRIRIGSRSYTSLMSMNDNGLSFRQIAKTIQEHCTLMFNEISPDEKHYIQSYVIPTRKQLREEAKLGEYNV